MDAGQTGRGPSAEDAPASCGQLLQRYRRAAGLTQEDLAERAGYSANYIGKLERDQRELPAAALDRLADVLALTDRDRSELRGARERRGGGRGLPAGPLAGRDAEMAQIRQLAVPPDQRPGGLFPAVAGPFPRLPQRCLLLPGQAQHGSQPVKRGCGQLPPILFQLADVVGAVPGPRS